ncbi:MAG: methionyl-tRNA formyltransferase [Syntrophomonadaceae bacterium]|nr:methionyl-tRNA formyltransferase [Syntrophomonadaceae bacterium]
MKIVFMGTSDFAVPSLTRLVASPHEVAGVITQPDRKKGRGKELLPTPVKKAALHCSLPIYQTSNIKSSEAFDCIKKWAPDLIVVVSYGQIIPPDILGYPELGCINVHASLLPKYRGPAPIQRALMAGERITGVTTMFMDEGVDTGDIIMQKTVAVREDMDCGELAGILAEEGAELLIKTIDILGKGDVPRRKQDEREASYAPLLTRKDEQINWSDSAVSIFNKIRALSPVPGAYSSVDGIQIKIFKSRIVSQTGSGVIAEVVDVSDKGFVVQTGEGVLEVLEVQREGKRRMLSSDFLKGFNLRPGDMFDR